MVKEVIDPELVSAQLENWRRIGQEVTEQLDYEPGRFLRRRTVRRKFVHRTDADLALVIAPLSECLLEHGIAATGLLAQVIVRKYCDHLPLYRQEQIFAQRYKINLPRQTLSRWMELAADWLKPINEAIRTGVMAGGYVKVDETPINYLDRGNGKTRQGYFGPAIARKVTSSFIGHPAELRRVWATSFPRSSRAPISAMATRRIALLPRNAKEPWRWPDAGRMCAGSFSKPWNLRRELRAGSCVNGLGRTIPLACQDWANTKAAYRFFSNYRINEAEILSGHFASTQVRAAALATPLLVLHDTTEFTFQATGSCIGLISNLARKRTVCGPLMHSSLVVTTEGLPLGLATVKFWTCKHFKGTNALKRKVNPTRIPIEEKENFKWLENLRKATELLQRPADCIHVGNRESDFYELFCAAAEASTKFLVRTCVDRLAKDGDTTIHRVMRRGAAKGTHAIAVRDADGKMGKAVLQIKYKTIKVLPPIGKQAAYPELELTVIHARETTPPRRRERIE